MDDARVPDTLFEFIDMNPDVGDFRTELLSGLAASPKTIPSKFFYDARGSVIFDRICALPEYYPTRTEIGILEARAAEIALLIGPNAHLIELGSGASVKIRTLLTALPSLSLYTAVDISRAFLLQSAGTLSLDYPNIDVAAVCADYTRAFDLPTPSRAANARRIVFFPGSTIGNFSRPDAAEFLTRIADILGPGGGLLVGVDLKKDPATLYAAYNDAQGVTAAFNFNLLRRANSELGADFDLAAFRHDAPYLEHEGRIEMRLYSDDAQKVSIGDETFEFAAGEYIHTENSHKYGLKEFRDMCETAGFSAVATWTDDDELFSVHYFELGQPNGQSLG